ncbi:TPA: hypothetical protein ACH9VN_004626 [Escherichia coli]
MEKRLRRGLLPVLGLLLTCSWSFAHMFFPALSPDSVDNRAAVFV